MAPGLLALMRVLLWLVSRGLRATATTILAILQLSVYLLGGFAVGFTIGRRMVD